MWINFSCKIDNDFKKVWQIKWKQVTGKYEIYVDMKLKELLFIPIYTYK